MPLFTRPSLYPDFCLSGTRTAPTTPLVNTGYVANQRPAADNHNYLFGTVGDWIRWLDQQEQLDEAQFEYDAIVGTNGSFPDINSLCTAIVGGAQLNNILVTTLQTLAATQIIPPTIRDLRLNFKPQAFYSKGGSVTPGLIIRGQRITVQGARFMNFSTGGDIAIQLDSASKNCRITNCSFFNCDTDIQDLGTGNVLVGNIVEV